MYKGASQNLQHRGSRNLTIDAMRKAGHENIVSDQERLESLKHALRDLDAKVIALPKKSPERKAMGLRKIALQNECAELKAKLKFLPKSDRVNLPSHFMDVAKERLDKWLFTSIQMEALKRLRVERAVLGLDDPPGADCDTTPAPKPSGEQRQITPTLGPTSRPLKAVDPLTTSLIEDALRRRAQRQAEMKD